MTDDDLLGVFDATVEAVRSALAIVTDWRPTTERPSQYAIDVAADGAAVPVLLDAGVGVLSEESGRHHPERPVTVVVDPVDGSTNASRLLPWYACSLCAVDADGPRAALVVNLATGQRFEAVRGGGAFMDGRPIRPTDQTELGRAVVGLSGYPRRHLGWKQYRALGASALDLSCVAAGLLDAFCDCTAKAAHGPWDYLGGSLICAEAGAVCVDAWDRDLLVREHDARRTPVAAATPELLAQLLAARNAAVPKNS